MTKLLSTFALVTGTALGFSLATYHNANTIIKNKNLKEQNDQLILKSNEVIAFNKSQHTTIKQLKTQLSELNKAKGCDKVINQLQLENRYFVVEIEILNDTINEIEKLNNKRR